MQRGNILLQRAEHLPEHRRRIERRRVHQLAANFERWCAGRDAARLVSMETVLPSVYLIDNIATHLQALRVLHRNHAEFMRHVSRGAVGGGGMHAHVLRYSKAMGSGAVRLRREEQALERDFGPDALAERYLGKVASLERDINIAVALLGLECAATLKATCSGDEDYALRWRQIGVEDGIAALLSYEGNMHVRLEAFRCLARALEALPLALHGTALTGPTTQYIYRLALEPRQDVWLQCEALTLLARVTPEFFERVVRQRLAQPLSGDDLFVRRRGVALIGVALAARPEWADLLEVVHADPSVYVRQELAKCLPAMPPAAADQYLTRLLADAENSVQAQALLALPDMLAARGGDWFADVLCGVIGRSEPVFTHRVALHVAEKGVEVALAQKLDAAPWGARLAAAADRLAGEAKDLRLRHWAAEAAEWLIAWLDASHRAALAELARVAGECAPGKACALPAALARLDPQVLGRLAQVAARRDFGLHLARGWRGWRLHRGHRFGFRSWRLLHELRNASPDKRQAFRHTIGRIFRGTIHAPSAILAELSETKVPGEPLHQAAEAGWRPYLPLPDQLISILDEPASAGPLQLFTAAGRTVVEAPRGLLPRLRARLALTGRFPRYAALRNWHESGGTSADSYVEALREIGFRIRFEAYPGRSANPAVQRFFAVAVPTGGAQLWQQIEGYFFSAYENTLYDLSLFIALAMSGFIGRHVFANYQLQRARRGIPLMIGGWGTRGKSGTERLKAALFNGLGYSVVSKTTGCEAMFLHAAPFQPLREMFLFRPYDKATIWEQHHVTRLAQRLGADVMLWECMALTPSFVHLLQQRWMRDDLATITNTFPDHEDLQGPAGVNIPEVMGNFIPAGRPVITSEEQMRPILADAAQHAGSTLIGVGWLESGLLAPDLLARFPYQEHPDNIALVLRMAAELGIEPDFAIREMADRVVPDLGVLKVFAPAPLGGRRLSFANGMSANERFGCLSNWARLAFDRIDIDDSPDTLVSTVVNNRADRVSRSRVFASILVDDISADLHFFIGSNLEGLRGYIREAWERRAEGLTLQPESGGTQQAALEAEARRLRMPYTPQRVQARLAVMLAGVGADIRLAGRWEDIAALAPALQAAVGEEKATEVLRFLQVDIDLFDAYRKFAAQVSSAVGSASSEALDDAFRALMWRAFERKLIVVDDYHASGNRVVQIIASHTPPGMHNRIMGIQNIKGTGLDFVYRWQAWDRCYKACEQLRSRDVQAFREGLRDLGGFQEFGLLGEETVRAALVEAAASTHAQTEHVQAELRVIEARLDQTMTQIHRGLARVKRTTRSEQLIRAIEGFADAGDALWRRKRANQIYEDLVAERISSARAVTALLELTQRQKGGWLYHSLRQRVQMMRAGVADLLAGIGLTLKRVAAVRFRFGRSAASPRRSASSPGHAARR